MEGEQGEQDVYDQSFIDQPAILDKYKAAAVVADAALDKAISLCVAGADVSTVCGEVDTFIEAELLKVFSNKKSKKLERGIGFPCCISINNVMGHFSPAAGEESVKLENEQVVKIELGAHIDGYASQAAHTIVIGGKSSGKQADVVRAAYDSFLAATRTIRVGSSNQDVTAAIAKVCEAYGVQPVQGVLSHKTKKHLIDGNEVIINIETPEQRVEDWDFAPGDVIALEVMTSTGEGMGKESEGRTMVFKREMDVQYSLKSKHARAFFSIVNQKYPTLPFSIRGFDDLTGAKVGVRECMEHGLIMDYPILQEKAGEFTAQFKATVVVQPKSTAILCGGRALVGADAIVSDKKLDAESAALVASDLWKMEKEKKATKK